MLNSKPMHHASMRMALIGCLLAVISLLCPTYVRAAPALIAVDHYYSTAAGTPFSVDAADGLLSGATGSNLVLPVTPTRSMAPC